MAMLCPLSYISNNLLDVSPRREGVCDRERGKYGLWTMVPLARTAEPINAVPGEDLVACRVPYHPCIYSTRPPCITRAARAFVNFHHVGAAGHAP